MKEEVKERYIQGHDDHKNMVKAMDNCPGRPNEVRLPDGGWGWVVVFSSFMVHTLTDGIIYTTGIFYVEYLGYFNSSKAETAWVASLLTSVTFIVGPFASIVVNKWGTIKCTIIGSILAALGLIISPLAPDIYFLYFSVGICTGVGFGLVYIPAIISVNSYFDRKRGIAMGIAACGAGIGTFLFSPLTEELVHMYTWKGASIILGGMVLNCCVFGCLFRPVETRHRKPLKHALPQIRLETIPEAPLSNYSDTKKFIPMEANDAEKNLKENHHAQYVANTLTSSPKDELLSKTIEENSENKQHNGLSYLNVRVSSVLSLQIIKEPKPRFSDFIDMSIFKDTTYNLFLISNFMGSIGFFVPFVYNKDRALLMGLTENQASILLSLMGMGNMVGKIVLGFISDRPWCNRLFLFNVCLIICGGSVIISCFFTSYEALIAYALVMGVTSGAYASLISVILADVLSVDKLTSAFGILSGLGGVACLIGPPLTGWLYDISQSYDTGFFVCGTLISLGGLMLFIPLVRDERLTKQKLDTIKV